MKITVVENKNVLKFEEVVVTKPISEDFLKATIISGASSGFGYALALMAQICTFDGKKLLMEDLKNLSGEDFLALSEPILGVNLLELEKQLSDSPDTAN